MIPRFFREAQAAARVDSPHLANVFDVNQEAGIHYLVMEFIRGMSAGAYLRQVKGARNAGLEEAVALEICIAATTGLAAAHTQGVIHRDLKPDNKMVPYYIGSSDQLDFQAAKLIDLGLARGEGLGGSLTGAGQYMGTPGYMAPEQAQDARSARKQADVFSMGATLYALLAGHAPFKGESDFDTMRKTVDAPHTPMRELRPGVSAATAALLDKCLAKDPAQRFADGSALLEALKVCRAALGDPAAQSEATRRLDNLGRVAEVGAPVKTPTPTPQEGDAGEHGDGRTVAGPAAPPRPRRFRLRARAAAVRTLLGSAASRTRGGIIGSRAALALLGIALAASAAIAWFMFHDGKDALPTFPLQSKYFADVVDNAMADEDQEATALEINAVGDILVALLATTDDHLNQHVTPEVTFHMVMRSAEHFRGHVFYVGGVLESVERFPISDNRSGLDTLYRGQVTGFAGEVCTFFSIQRPPEELIKHHVCFTGIFLKRYAYKNRLAGEKLTWTPAFFVRNVEADAGYISMTLPRASEAVTDKDLFDRGVNLNGRMVIQLAARQSTYRVVINGRDYALVPGGANKNLLEYLDNQVNYMLGKGLTKKDSTGAVDIPVKLRIPADAPMGDVERVIMALARCGLVNLQFAAVGREALAECVLPQKLPTPRIFRWVRNASADGKDNLDVNVSVSPRHHSALYQFMTREVDINALPDMLKKEAVAGRKYQVRISYEADVPWEHVMAVLNACAKVGIAECGFVPLRPDANPDIVVPPDLLKKVESGDR